MKIDLTNNSLVNDCYSHLEEISKIRYEYYLSKGHQKSLEGIRKDFERGFIGEIIAYEALKTILPDIEPPNFNLFEKSEKKGSNYSWDLKNSKYNFSVKTCFTNDTLWSYSCNFDKKDILRNFNYNDWFILVGLDDNLAIGEVLLICPINYIKKFLDVPLSPKLREWKTAIYLQEKLIKDLKRKTKIVNNNAMNFFINKLV